MPLRLPADRVHAWRVERQLLGPEKAGTPAEVAHRLVGVQAQVTSSAALSIALRSKQTRGADAPVDRTTRALHDRSLVRTWAMRSTLHLKRVSRTAGWISPVVLRDGRAIGVWDSARAGSRLRITVDAFGDMPAVERGRIAAAAEHVAAAQGLVAKVGYGPVFATKGAPLRISPDDS